MSDRICHLLDGLEIGATGRRAGERLDNAALECFHESDHLVEGVLDKRNIDAKTGELISQFFYLTEKLSRIQVQKVKQRLAARKRWIRLDAYVGRLEYILPRQVKLQCAQGESILRVSRQNCGRPECTGKFKVFDTICRWIGILVALE